MTVKAETETSSRNDDPRRARERIVKRMLVGSDLVVADVPYVMQTNEGFEKGGVKYMLVD